LDNDYFNFIGTRNKFLLGIEKSIASMATPTRGAVFVVDNEISRENFSIKNMITEPSFSDSKNLKCRCKCKTIKDASLFTILLAFHRHTLMMQMQMILYDGTVVQTV